MDNKVVRHPTYRNTPKDILDSFLANVDDTDLIIIMSRDKGGIVRAGWSACRTDQLAHTLMCGDDLVRRDGVFNAVNEVE